jgi:hypothetical protein
MGIFGNSTKLKIVTNSNGQESGGFLLLAMPTCQVHPMLRQLRGWEGAGEIPNELL